MFGAKIFYGKVLTKNLDFEDFEVQGRGGGKMLPNPLNRLDFDKSNPTHQIYGLG